MSGEKTERSCNNNNEPIHRGDSRKRNLPNIRSKQILALQKSQNITFHSAYEPGSLAKPFVLAEAIDEGVVNFNRRYYCGEGKIVVDGKKIRDHKKFKMLTAEEIIIYSSNVGAIKLALKLDPKSSTKTVQSRLWKINKNISWRSIRYIKTGLQTCPDSIRINRSVMDGNTYPDSTRILSYSKWWISPQTKTR